MVNNKVFTRIREAIPSHAGLQRYGFFAENQIFSAVFLLSFSRFPPPAVPGGQSYGQTGFRADRATGRQSYGRTELRADRATGGQSYGRTIR